MPRGRPTPADVAFERVRGICCVFPGVEAKLSHGAPSFFVRGKMFLAFVDDHHGGGRLAVWCKSAPDEQRALVACDPDRFFIPPYVGPKGWVGVRLDHPRADWVELAILVETGWHSIAPKNLSAITAKPMPVLRRPKTDDKIAREALARMTAICLALPEAARDVSARHATFTVGKKAFAYFLDNHHGDEIIAACVRTPKEESAARIKADPRRFYWPAYIGPKGWLGIRLDVARVDWRGVADRIAASYAGVAPKRLLAKEKPGSAPR